MRRRHRSWFPVLAAFVLAAALATGPVEAQSLDALRESGVVGERFDGFAQVRDAGAPEEVRSLVKQVNDKRREIYAKRAIQEGVPVDQVGRVYAKKILHSAPEGTWFLDGSGQWTQK